ncbi:MAG: M18 family aminopeptidase [Proteobacteria bacterium]|nr:M18 family aminopeptidase [Pseudomonadota bacterium]
MINDFISFLEASPVNFLACREIKRRLDLAGYKAFNPADSLIACAPGDRFYITKNDSSIYAFHIGQNPMWQGGFRLICAHCDSPTFRIKPNPDICVHNKLVKLNVEAYGGVIYNTWFDRPLSIAGRVIVKGQDAMHPVTHLLHIKRPLLTIPNLCIHFNRQVNDGTKISVQKEIQPILGLVADELEKKNMLLQCISKELDIPADQILDFDLYLYDTSAPCTLGIHDEFISAGRLDDLEMVYAGLEALTASGGSIPQTTQILAIFDNEETGSHTKQGAASPFLASFIQRMILAQNGSMDDYYRAIEHAFMVSADNAHAYHPNYSEKSDPVCYPMLGDGPAIKFNAAQKYASDAFSASVFASICKEAGIPCQKFVNHGDVAGGSTLGNIFTSTMPIQGVDMGAAILAMHSIRETGSVKDLEYCIRAFEKFYTL